MAYRRKKSGVLGLMGGKNRKKKNIRDLNEEFGSSGHFSVSQQTKRGIFIIFLFAVGALSLLALFSLAGQFGQYLARGLAMAFGWLKWIFPFLIFLFGYFLLREDKYKVKVINYLGGFIFLLGLAAILQLKFYPNDAMTAAGNGLGGGYLGVALSWPLYRVMSFWGTLVVSITVFLVGLLLIFETSIYGLLWPIKLVKIMAAKLSGFNTLAREKVERADTEEEEGGYEEEPAEEAAEPVEEVLPEEEPAHAAGVAGEAPQFQKKYIGDGPEAEVSEIAKPKKFGKIIELPIELLTVKSGKPTSGDIKGNQAVIKKTLANFNIEVEMGEVNIGPTVTQYTLRPADGVKLSRITNLNSDLSLSLAAHPIRIEAPIPGRSLVGVEVPNQMAARVSMGDLLSSKEFKIRNNNLNLAMGKDVSGQPYFAPLEKMPHMLIAGATGSGKSVCINSIIVSLLYQNSPDELKFILVDPKRVELPVYNGIPYLLTPVITDVKKTINALKWTIVEMERRFDVLSKAGRRNIESYNKESDDKLPYIVFIIDELADLMSAAGNDIEAGIVRLAQMSRAVGIHLILATQRPSVEVITGLIKANIPARVAFSVASLIDSRTILDSSGAEKLVGRGDMLYIGPGVSRPKRLQGVFVSDKEIKTIVDYIKGQGMAEYVPGVVEKQSEGLVSGSASWAFGDDGDSLLGEAKEVIRETGKASATLLQRRLKVGYARAARILDLLEDQGVVGPADGAKARDVFLDRLGGVDDVVEFAAREHGLEGELMPASPTVFKEDTEVVEDTANNEEEDEETEASEPEVENNIEEVVEENNIADDSAKEEVADDEAEADNSDSETEEMVPAAEAKKADKKSFSKSFSEDEWT